MDDGQYERLLAEIAESRRHTDERFTESWRHTDERFGEAKREFHVLAEASRSAIQQVAEGVATLDAKLDRLGAELRADSAETRSLLRLAFANLDRRVTRLEGELHPG